MLRANHIGALEVRFSEGGETRLSGNFPYNVETVLGRGPSGQAYKEVFASRAFGASLEDEAREVHFLVGHEHSAPVAARSAGSLSLSDTDEGLNFEVRISKEVSAVTHISDLIAMMRAKLVRGLSPGFRVQGEADEDVQRMADGSILRTINRAELIELSAVTRPAYPEAQIQARNWTPGEFIDVPTRQIARYR